MCVSPRCPSSQATIEMCSSYFMKGERTQVLMFQSWKGRELRFCFSHGLWWFIYLTYICRTVALRGETKDQLGSFKIPTVFFRELSQGYLEKKSTSFLFRSSDRRKKLLMTCDVSWVIQIQGHWDKVTERKGIVKAVGCEQKSFRHLHQMQSLSYHDLI